LIFGGVLERQRHGEEEKEIKTVLEKRAAATNLLDNKFPLRVQKKKKKKKTRKERERKGAEKFINWLVFLS
jgi:transcription antitermination factor NusG